MIQFLIKGLMRDHSRSFFPICIVALSVSLLVLMQAYMQGAMGGIVEINSHFDSGHVKISTYRYAMDHAAGGNESAIDGNGKLLDQVEKISSDYQWNPRIKFGGILDFPAYGGESIEQGTVAGLGVDLLSKNSRELDNLNLKKSIVKGRWPTKSGEVLLSNDFFSRLNLDLGAEATLISSAMDGSTAVLAVTIVGTISFGVAALDRGAMIADLSDIRSALYMDDAATEILGFRKQGYDKEATEKFKEIFNNKFSDKKKPYSPYMRTIRDQGGFAEMIDLSEYMSFIMVSFYLFIVVIVLWNAGLRNGVRRYSEFGLRMAIGESFFHVYGTLLLEALFIGLCGGFIGEVLGLFPAYYLQEVGFNIKEMMDTATMPILFQDIIRAEISATTLWIGFVPGLLAPLFGTAVAGLSLFKRNLSQLFKELEV